MSSVTRVLALATASAALLAASAVTAETYLLDKFEGSSFDKEWTQSSWKGNEMGKFKVSSGDWYGDADAARGIVTTEDAKFYAASRKLTTPVATTEGKKFVVQYNVKTEKKGSSYCAGGYVKLLPSTYDASSFGGDSPYLLMFGPDVCGYDISRVHLIFAKDGENMLKKEDVKLEYSDKNEFTHVFRLVVSPDNTYEISVDGNVKEQGSLGNGQWSKFAPKEILDPSDTKPADWVDTPKIIDPAAVKPEDWDENAPKTVVDPEASKPTDWDDAEDGEWEAPVIDNPKYKGKWQAPLIENPAYKGPWTQKTMANPEYDAKNYVLKDVAAIGLDLWVVNSGTIFSNLYVGDSTEEADKLMQETFTPFVEKEKEAKKVIDDAEKAAAEAAAPPPATEEEVKEEL